MSRRDATVREARGHETETTHCPLERAHLVQQASGRGRGEPAPLAEPESGPPGLSSDLGKADRE